MSEQLSLLGDATAEETVPVAPTPQVLVHGANEPEVPRHRDAGRLGSAGVETARLMLALAEDALRYNQAPNPRLVVPEKRGRGIGSNGPIGRNSLMADGKGIRDFQTGESATWPQLLRTLAAQREEEPHVARARDLAEAYHRLSYYARLRHARRRATEVVGQPPRGDPRPRRRSDARPVMTRSPSGVVARHGGRACPTCSPGDGRRGHLELSS